MYKLFIIVFLFTLVISGCAQNQTAGQYDAFATCLSEKGLKMYGTEWCSHCKDQKAMFGSSFALVDYTDCDKKKLDCTAAGVNGYPTWITADGKPLVGAQPLKTLSQESNCAFP